MFLLTKDQFNRLLRIWLFRLTSASVLDTASHDEKILTLFVATIDRYIDISPEGLYEGVKLAAEFDKHSKGDEYSEEDVISTLQQTIIDQKEAPQPVTTATNVLQVLVNRIFDPQRPDRLDIAPTSLGIIHKFLSRWFQTQDEFQEKVGGASAIVAEELSRLGLPNVTLWLRYLSDIQASAFNSPIAFLQIDDPCQISTVPIQTASRPDDPTIINYSLEFREGIEFKWLSDKNSNPLKASKSDRVIAICPGYQHFRTDGSVKSVVVPPLTHLLTSIKKTDHSCIGESDHE